MGRSTLRTDEKDTAEGAGAQGVDKQPVVADRQPQGGHVLWRIVGQDVMSRRATGATSELGEERGEGGQGTTQLFGRIYLYEGFAAVHRNDEGTNAAGRDDGRPADSRASESSAATLEGPGPMSRRAGKKEFVPVKSKCPDLALRRTRDGRRKRGGRRP